VFVYANILTSSFFLSAFFYWFLVLLFIFFFCLLGIFISVCSISPNRSLVYSLLTWIMLCIILPISWDYIVSPQLFNDDIVQLQRNENDRRMQAWEWLRGQRISGMYMYHNGGRTHSIEIWSFTETYESWYEYLVLLNSEYFNLNREIELATDNIIRKRIIIDNVRNSVFFYNPIVLFNDISNQIAGNSRADYLRFLHEGRGIRDDFVNLGTRDGWLLDYRFFAHKADPDLLGSQDLWMDKFMSDLDTTVDELMAIGESAESFSFEMPFIRRYEQPNPSVTDIFSRIVMVLSMLVVSSLALWILTWNKFMRYDVR
jgi:hypothetical protein